MPDAVPSSAPIGALAASPAPVDAFDRRFSVSLHGLRGLAALCVFFNHFADFLREPSRILSPLAWLEGGLEAVALFFLLSGAVLGLSLRRFELDFRLYFAYGARRAIRLLPVVVVATSLGCAYATWARFAGPSAVLSDEFFRYYKSDRHLIDLLYSWTGLYAGLDPPMWSIYVEIVGSILMPAFVLVARRLGPCLALVAVLTAVSLACSGLDGRLTRNYWPVYMVNFGLGLLACHAASRPPALLRRLPTPAVAVLTLVLFLLLMNLHEWLGLPKHGYAPGNLLDAAIAFALVVVLLVREDVPYNEIALRWLGDISYPLYLLHWPVMALVLTLLLRRVGEPWALGHPELYALAAFALSLGLTLALSVLVFRFVERPAIAWGKRRFGRRRVAVG